jgi:hypothetical protein
MLWSFQSAFATFGAEEDSHWQEVGRPSARRNTAMSADVRNRLGIGSGFKLAPYYGHRVGLCG